MPEFVRVNADVKTMFLPGQLKGLAGLRIHLDLKIGAGEFLIDSGAERPTLIPWMRVATGYVRSDGRMYDLPAVSAAPHDLDDPGELGVLVPADDPNFNLENSVAYHVTCELPVAGRDVVFKQWDIVVPSSETTVDLGGLTPGPAQEVIGVPELVNLDMVNGVGTAGKEIARAVTQAAAQIALGGGAGGRPVFEAGTTGAARAALGATEVGSSLFTAAGEAEAREAIAAVGKDDPYGPIDLRRQHWKIAAGQWQTVNGAAFTSGQYTMTKPGGWTDSDVGKTVVANEDHAGTEFTRWMAEIDSVSPLGVATLDTAAPSTSAGQRISWGWDITDELNAALLAVAAAGYVPREVYLPGYYRARYVALPLGIKFKGSGWGYFANLAPLLSSYGTLLHQLPGSQRNFVVFRDPLNANGRNWMGPVSFGHVALQGPEKNVRACAPTVGYGLSMRTPGGAPLTPQDGCDFDRVRIFNFPQGGVEFPAGVVPLTPKSFQCIFNGGYGMDITFDADTAQMLHLSDPSADGNVSGGVIFRDGAQGGTVLVTAFKSESVNGSFYGTSTGFNTVTGWEGVDDDVQRAVLTFENCDGLAVVANGISNIRGGGSTQGPGPAILLTGSTIPHVSFSGIGTRVTDAQLADSDDAVTLRDEVNDVDIPRTVTTGVYPLGASNLGRTQESVTTSKTLDHFFDHVVFIGSGGVPTLPSAVGMAGARCWLVNVHTANVSAVIDGNSVAILPGESVIVESNGATWVRFAPASVAQVTHAATSKSTPVDADEIPLADSAASWVLKKLTWANLKAGIRTYIESLTTLTLTTPKIVNYIADSAGAILIGLNSVASAVNYLQVSNRATGVKPSITATGSDTDVGGNLASKGAGVWSMNNNEIMTAVRTINPQTGTSYTLAATDAGHTVTLNNASPVTVDVPTNGTVPMSNGTRIELSTIGAGTVTVNPAGGVTVNATPGLKIPQYVTGTLTKISANVWTLTGAGLTA